MPTDPTATAALGLAPSYSAQEAAAMLGRSYSWLDQRLRAGQFVLADGSTVEPLRLISRDPEAQLPRPRRSSVLPGLTQDSIHWRETALASSAKTNDLIIASRIRHHQWSHTPPYCPMAL